MTLHSRHWLQPLDKMQRISRQEFAERIDEILDTLDKEDIGYVITNDGKDDLVACPARWFITEPSDDFGLIVNSAVRYAIGRESYMPKAYRQALLSIMCASIFICWMVARSSVSSMTSRESKTTQNSTIMMSG